MPESPFHSPDPCHPERVIVIPPATKVVKGIAQSPGSFLHCLTVADCNPCGASQIHIGVIKPGSSGRELTQEIMIIVTIVGTVSIAKNSPYRIERYRECYIVFANTISPLLLCFTDCNYRISKITIRMDTSIGIVPFFNPCWFPIMTRRNVFSMFGKANSIYL